MRAALIGAAGADVGAQRADLLCERTVARDRICAQPAHCRAIDTAGRTLIDAFLADHVRETVAALGRAIVAGVDAIFRTLVQMMAHGVCPSVDFNLLIYRQSISSSVRCRTQRRAAGAVNRIKHGIDNIIWQRCKSKVALPTTRSGNLLFAVLISPPRACGGN